MEDRQTSLLSEPTLFSQSRWLLVLGPCVLFTKRGKLEISRCLCYRMFPGRTTTVCLSLLHKLSLCGHLHAPVCVHSGRLLRYWLYISPYSQSTEFPIDKSTLASFDTYEEAPGPSETEGRCFIRGASRFVRVAERQVCRVLSVPLFNNIFSPLSC